MDRDDFLDGLKQNFFDKIHGCAMECEHHEEMNFNELDKKLAHVWSAAKTEGVKWDEYSSWAQECIPEYFDKLTFFKTKKAA